jgi:hypothetical protein
MRVVPLSQQLFSYERFVKELHELEGIVEVELFSTPREAYKVIKSFFGDSGTPFCRATARHIFCSFLVSEISQQLLFDLRNQTELAILTRGKVNLVSGTLDRFIDAFDKFTSFESHEHRLLFTKVALYLQRAGFEDLVITEKVEFHADGTYSTVKTSGRKVFSSSNFRSKGN